MVEIINSKMPNTMTLTESEMDVSAMDGSPRHSQHMDETETVVFNDCTKGLGIKIIGGKSDQDGGRDYGIFVRRIIPGGLAEQSGRLREGDQILSVNGQSLLRVTNEEAVQQLRNASATNQVTLVITRDMSSARRFSSLVKSQLANTRNTFNMDSQSVSSDHSSETPDQDGKILSSHQTGRMSAQSSLQSLQSPGELGPGTGSHGPPDIYEIHLNKLSGLGLAISGGSDQPDGPGVFIQGIQPDGDCYRDGRLRVGDQLVSVNGEPLSGATKDVAVEILTRASCRTDIDTIQIAYIPTSSSHPQPNSPILSPTQLSPSRANQHPSPHQYPSPHPTSPSQQPNVGNRQGSPYSKPNGLSPHSPQEAGHHVAPPLYEQAVTDGYSLSALRHQAPPNIAMPLHLQRHLHIQPASSSTPQQTNGITNGHADSIPLPYSTQLEPSPVLPTNSITTSTHNHMQLPFTDTPTLGVSPVSPTPSKGSSRSRRLSLDPHVRLRIDKLEVALKYLGIEPTLDERRELRRRLWVDESGTAPYGDFVAVARQIFKMQLDDSQLGSGSLTFAAHDVTDFAEPPPINHQAQLSSPIMSPVSELDRIRRERDKALRDVERLKAQLLDKDRSFNVAEEELLRIRKEAQGAIHESRALKSRVHLAESAQREARNIEIDYEEVVHMLEAEVAMLRRKTAKSTPVNKADQAEVDKLRKRLSIMSCELKKAEICKRTQEVATEKLLQFAELVHEYHTNGPNSITTRPRGRGESTRQGDTGSLPPGYLANHSKPGPLSLATEAKETVKAVKKLVEVEPLPYGWEEAYTADGRKYYINHVTRGTSWLHPVSSVNHVAADNENDKNVPETRT